MGRWRRGNPAFFVRRYAVLLVLPPLLYFVWLLAASPSIAASNGCPQCDHGHFGEQERFMWYAPHSGFSNQVGELRNALRVAAILGRTLVVPPVTDHHALSLGSCPKYRIVEPARLRAAAWSHISDLAAQSRYYSIADILNISSVSPRFVKTIDLRVFALLWCGADIKSACAGPLCHELADRMPKRTSLHQCGSILAQQQAEPRVAQQCSDNCVYGVDHSCATTVWTHRRRSSMARRGLLMQDSKLKTKKFDGERVERGIYETLGSHKARVLAFGSLFSGIYQGAQTHLDLSAPSGDEDFDEVLRATRFFPFTAEIERAGESYIDTRMKQRPFFCAQLRLLDGQFKNHWSKSFTALKARLEEPEADDLKAIFVMTDLPRSNWSGTYLEELLNSRRYELFSLEEGDELVGDSARRILASEHGIRSGYVVPDGGFGGARARDRVADAVEPVVLGGLSDILLYVQEAICSSASLGFQGTAGSTITENIMEMRNQSI